ncbi:hypothetical protein QN277_009918 [Acacia crassicarpa]|uniref:RNase H type-1 domain-containing protein n=1 Tax=Acacia crassicarpa TaxID=499986 RepID=A0AAE1IQ60_9FABA|nr:hypothetical protein QN277_009918 [Acacia crassicarpa]
MHYLGSCEAFEAEGWAIAKGLNLAWELGCRRVILESDAKVLIDSLLVDSSAEDGDLIIWLIGQLLRRDWKIKLRHIPRERNKMADALAKEGLVSSKFLDVYPEVVRTLYV